MQPLWETAFGRFRILAFLEGVSLLVILFVTMPLKYWYDMPAPNKFWGMLHGILFIAYVLWVIQLKIEQNWSWQKTFLALIAAILPLGTFWADRKLFQIRS
ncbi:MAG: DUF3817 domain-containing protein [Microscillaceae bacterium]|nr:DUF3817 domain-containing protein [Microscillaceae bacterium]MDW8461581.1 DUF3817 domain-containing protein [Cytophagales bacterium]